MHRPQRSFDESPFIVFWETIQTRDLHRRRNGGLATASREHPQRRRSSQTPHLPSHRSVSRRVWNTGGGARARAYALTGDLVAEGPACAYEPGAASSGP